MASALTWIVGVVMMWLLARGVIQLRCCARLYQPLVQRVRYQRILLLQPPHLVSSP